MKKAIIIFRSAALGDFILATPAMAKVRELYPDHRIVLLTTQSASKAQREKVAHYAGNTARMPWVDLARPRLIDDVVVLDNLNSFAALWQVRKHLQSLNVEQVILMLDPCAPWLGRIKKWLLMLFLVGRVPVLGWRGKGSLNGDRAALKQAGLLRHHVHGSLQFMAELSPPQTYRDEDLRFPLEPGEEARNWAATWLAEQGLQGRRLLAIAPGSIQPHKRWPIEKFAALLREVLAQYPDLAVLVIGTPNDAALAEVLCAVDPQRVFSLAGVSSIAQSAAVLNQCDLLLGNDGGAMHLGDAMGCKVISLVPGIEYPDSIEPWHNKALAIRHPVPCAPCYDFLQCPQGDNRCMNEIEVRTVWEQVNRVLG